MKTYTFTIDNETFEMTMEELAANITVYFAKTFLTDEEFEIFCKTQEEIWEESRLKQEEYRRTHYIYDETGNYYD